MLVIVRKDYFDLQADKTLRKAGQLIDYKNEERANELLKKGFVRRAEILEVEDTKKEVKKRPAKK